MTPLVILPAALAAAPVASDVPLDAVPLQDRVVLIDAQTAAVPASPPLLHIVAAPRAAPPPGLGEAGLQDAAKSADTPVATAPAKTTDLTAVHVDRDPLEGFNRVMFKIFRVFDRFIIRPVAMIYKAILPEPVRDGIRNILSNLGEPIVFVNDLLQLKFKRAGATFGRFVLNSTWGLGGTIDIARRAGNPHHDNGFGDTLAFYGVGPGPYIFLPVLGPSTLRDMLGGAGDGLLLPKTVGTPFSLNDYQIATEVSGGLDQRVRQDQNFKALLAGAVDPYATLRSAYLQDRAAQVRALRGKSAADPLADPLSDPLSDPLADPAAASSKPGTSDDPLADPATSAPAKPAGTAPGTAN